MAFLSSYCESVQTYKAIFTEQVHTRALKLMNLIKTGYVFDIGYRNNSSGLKQIKHDRSENSDSEN